VQSVYLQKGKMKEYKNILIIQTAFIGDAILASSLLEKLHTTFPASRLSILVRKGNESVFKDHPFLQEVLVWDKTENKTRNLFKLLFAIRKRKFDCVIDCHRFASSGFLTGFSGAAHKAGYKQTPFSYLFNTTVKHVIGNGKHEVERYDQLIVDFTDKKLFKPKLYPSDSDKNKSRIYKVKPYSCIAPASVWATKQLPENKWVELIQTKLKGKKVFLLGAGSDKDLCERIKNALPDFSIENLSGKLSLLESCALMQDAEMNYVNDSAPLHLASSVNAPVTAFFCSTVPEFGFGPLSDNSQIFQVSGLKCRPCGLHGHKKCPEGHFKCGTEMKFE